MALDTTIHLIEELGARKYPLRMGHEKSQQPEFGGANVEQLAMCTCLMARRVDHQGAVFQRRLGMLRRAPAQQGIDP